MVLVALLPYLERNDYKNIAYNISSLTFIKSFLTIMYTKFIELFFVYISDVIFYVNFNFEWSVEIKILSYV